MGSSHVLLSDRLQHAVLYSLGLAGERREVNSSDDKFAAISNLRLRVFAGDNMLRSLPSFLQQYSRESDLSFHQLL